MLPALGLLSSMREPPSAVASSIFLAVEDEASAEQEHDQQDRHEQDADDDRGDAASADRSFWFARRTAVWQVRLHLRHVGWFRPPRLTVLAVWLAVLAALGAVVRWHAMLRIALPGHAVPWIARIVRIAALGIRIVRIRSAHRLSSSSLLPCSSCCGVASSVSPSPIVSSQCAFA